MNIGILSDTHNQLSNLISCITTLEDRHVQTVIHCGDLVDEDLIQYFMGFQLIYLFGNTDMNTSTIQKRVQHLGNGSQAGYHFEGVLGGKRIFAAHGDVEGQISQAAQSKLYDYVFYGHTHRFKDESRCKTRLINPGALGGIRRESRSFCILDLETGKLERIQVADKG